MAHDSMNAFYLFIFESFVNKTFKRSINADKNSLSSLASSDVMMEFISSRDFFDRKSHFPLPHGKPINGLVLSTFCFLTNQRKVQILDQQQTNSQVIVLGVPSRHENKGTPDRRLRYFPRLARTYTNSHKQP